MPVLVGVWEEGALVPNKDSELGGELALERDLFRATDAGLSRWENSPKLSPDGEAGAELFVPVRAGLTPLVIEDCSFGRVQEDVPPAAQTWKVAPAQLSEPGRLALGANASLGYVRQIHWDRDGETHHLLLLPPGRRVRHGERVKITAPALIVLGTGAVHILPNDTQAPAQQPKFSGCVLSVQPPEHQFHFGLTPALDTFETHLSEGQLFIPWRSTPLDAVDLPVACGEILRMEGRDNCFIPVLEDDLRLRLAFIYSRADGSSGALLSDLQIRNWLARLDQLLATQPRPTRPAPSLPPPAREPLSRFGSVQTRNRNFAKVLEHVRTIGPGAADLVILGETGTGKEHLARAIHDASARKHGPFVAYNCGMGSKELLESELFGHVKGAFTGAASARRGKFMEASGGTLLLDELGDASLHVQLALLRVLETRRLTPVGADREQPVDVRVLAATSQPLEQLVESGQFRRDLYHRLAGGEVHLPALRERPEDLPDLCATLLATIGSQAQMSDDALSYLARSAWPGNIRQLRKALEAAVHKAGSSTQLLLSEHFDIGRTHHEWVIPERPAVFFDDAVKSLAAKIWQEQALPPMSDLSKPKRRAVQRAALLYLDSTRAHDEWPKRMLTHWSRLFGPVWATSEGGRGMRDLLAALCVDLRDAQRVEKAREWVEERVE